MESDYSKFPGSIRHALPYVEGGVSHLRAHWTVFHYLFAENPMRLELLGQKLGPLLGMFQEFIEPMLILDIAKLTDKDNRQQQNLSLYSLLPAVHDAKSDDFGPKVMAALSEIETAVVAARTHRHKHIAHLDAVAGIDLGSLPPVTLRDLQTVIEKMEAFLNLFHLEFTGGFVDYDTLSAGPIVAAMERTVFKAVSYDQLEIEGVIPYGHFERIQEQYELWGQKGSEAPPAAPATAP